MKNLTKIFMAVVAGMLAFSCVTDITEDQAVQLGADQTTTIGLSLESDVRTHITGKDGNNEYPMYWSKDDKIAVNGKTSNALAEEYHGQKQALFTVNAVLNYPRAIVYPAPAEGVQAVAEDCQVVTFPALQAYTAGTFAEGSVPMYGYVADENATTTLNHLAGVLRIPVKCAEGVESTLLKAMVVEVNHGSIAGNFDINCATGKLTAHADALNTVTVTFGEGLTLTNEATPVYVAIPAGEYGSVSITLYTDNSSYTARFSTFFDKVNDKMVKAGTVREFSTPIEYVPNASSDTFLIYDEASLRNFASRVNAAEENFDTTYPNAKVVANIDLTGKEWTPIEGYAGSIDGLNHKIIGLTAPLFGTTNAASIKNLHLVDVNITASGSNVGPMACLIRNAAAVIENCSTSGKLHVVGKAEIAATDGGTLQYGGFIGYSHSEQIFTNITSDVDITATGQFSVAIHLCGFAGSAKSGLENATNLGTVTFSGEMLNSESIYLHGFAYVVAKGLTNCVNGSANDNNAGALTVTKDAKCANIIMTGIEQNGCATLKNCINYGDIKKEADGVIVLLAGICRWSEKSNIPNFTNVINRGDILISGKSSQYSTVGGIMTQTNHGGSFTDCHNYGNIVVNEDYNIVAGRLYIGGIVGSIAEAVTMTIDGCNNYGDITFKGTITDDSTGAYFGGLTSAMSNAQLTLQGGCTNYGAIDIGGTNTSETGIIRIGGCAGIFTLTPAGSGVITNKGSINCSIDTACPDQEDGASSVHVGGWAGVSTISWSGGNFQMHNCGDITCTTAEKEGITVRVGGILGMLKDSGNYFIGTARVFCNIEAKGSDHVGMLISADRHENSDKTITSGNTRACSLGGTIWKKGMEKAVTIDVTNYFNYMHGTTPDWKKYGITNYDRCRYISSFEAAPESAIEPFVIDSKEKLLEFKANVANIKQPIKFTADINMSGVEWTPIAGYTHSGKTVAVVDGGGHKINGLTAPLFGATDASIKNLHLTNINMKYRQDVLYKVDGSNTYAVMGALVCHQSDQNATIENCSASGTITINESSTILSYVGGLVGHSLSKQTFKDLVNNVNIDVSGTLSKSLYVAGCVAYTDGSLKSCKNLGNINIDLGANTSAAYTLAAAGVSTTCNDVTECTNGSDKKDELNKYGNITIRGDKLSRIHYFSGVACNSRNIYKSTNYGKLDIGGTITHSAGSFMIGGIFSFANKLKTVADCKNYGDIELSGNSNANGHIAGIGVTITENIITLSDVYNYGNITYSETNSKAATYIGGILNTTSKTNLHNACNYGNVTVDGTTATDFYLGGIVGRLNSVGKLSGNIINEGVIRMGANASGKNAYVGGLFGGCNTAVIDITGDNIYSRGPIIVEEGATATNGIYIGGVIGSLAEATTHNPKIIGVKSACEIEAIGRDKVGMIIGTERDADNPKVKDCRVGGLICKSKSGQGEAVTYDAKILDANNYYHYIYSGGTSVNWTGAIRYDGNIFDSTLEPKPMPEE